MLCKVDRLSIYPEQYISISRILQNQNLNEMKNDTWDMLLLYAYYIHFYLINALGHPNFNLCLIQNQIKTYS